ncbi:MAG: hypothetical protein H6582_08075 [Crocinitomicaceae bacterium]|nr:hypothetical protein [Crocinitomicaceae bacterium]
MPCPPDDLHLRQQQIDQENRERAEFEAVESLFLECLPFDDNGGELNVQRLKDLLMFQDKILWINVYLLKLNLNDQCPENIRSRFEAEKENCRSYLQKKNYKPRNSVNPEFFKKSPIMLKYEEYELEKNIRDSIPDLEKVINQSDIFILMLPEVPINKMNLLGWNRKLNIARNFLNENRHKEPIEIYSETEVHLCNLRGFLARIYFEYRKDVDSILFDDAFLKQIEKHKKHRDEDRIERIMSIEKLISDAKTDDEKSVAIELRKKLNSIGLNEWLFGIDV